MKKLVPSDSILIPDNATTVFEGQIFSVHQWPQEMFDGSTKTFEMLRRPDTVQVLVARANQILLVHDEQPGRPMHTHFPGGRPETDDASWLTTAKRELREESGLVCGEWRLISVEQPVTKIEWFTPIYLASEITQELEQMLDVGGEKITVEWFDFTDVRNRVLSGNEQMMEYLIPFFSRVESMDQLINHPDFEGNEIER